MTGLLCFIAAAAFEPQSESPWLSGAAAAALFPRSHMALTVNPAAIGLIDETAVSITASRPFGFSELDRTAVAGGFAEETFAAAGYTSVSGRDGYLETTFTAAGAFNLRRGLVSGVSASWHRLSIEDFGASSAFSLDAGLIARPIEGLYLGSSVRGLFSTSPEEGGMGAVPRTVSCSAGVCPLEGVILSAAASLHQYAGREYSAVTSVEPFPGIALSASVLTPPARMGFTVQFTLNGTSVQYGYSTHPDLPSGHALGVIHGTSGFRPPPISFDDRPAEPAAAVFPLDVNTATEQELVQIPGVGPSTAAVIRRYIESNGPLETVDQLIEIPGIGPATLETLRSYLTV